MDTRLSLAEALKITRARQGISYKEMGERLAGSEYGDGKIRKVRTPGSVMNLFSRGEHLTVRMLRDLCEAMDCDLRIDIVPREK